MTLYGPDFYPPNFNSGPLPLSRMVADKRVSFVILKYSEGVSYPTWAVVQGARVRKTRLTLGGYHFLRWDLDGGKQADFFLSRYKPQAGDIAPTVDYEGGGPTHPNRHTSTSTAKANLKAFIARIHQRGFKCMVYGHADVKAHFGTFKATGADFYWCPGDVLHTDAGPVDLWQYSPYTTLPNAPSDPAGIGRSDVSKVVTVLPIIGGDDLTPEQAQILKDAKAFLDAARKSAGNTRQPGKPAAASGLGTRVGRAVKKVEAPVGTVAKHSHQVFGTAK